MEKASIVASDQPFIEAVLKTAAMSGSDWLDLMQSAGCQIDTEARTLVESCDSIPSAGETKVTIMPFAAGGTKTATKATLIRAKDHGLGIPDPLLFGPLWQWFIETDQDYTFDHLALMHVQLEQCHDQNRRGGLPVLLVKKDALMVGQAGAEYGWYKSVHSVFLSKTT